MVVVFPLVAYGEHRHHAARLDFEKRDIAC